MDAHDRCRRKCLELAREIAGEGKYVGLAAFVLLGLVKKKRPRMWIGENREDLLGMFAAEAAQDIEAKAACDGICVCSRIKPGSLWEVEYVPVSETSPLGNVRHYMVGMPMEAPFSEDPDDLPELHRF